MTGPDNSAFQVFYGTLPLMVTAVLAIWNNNKRLNEMSKRMDDIKSSLENRIGDLHTGFGRRMDDFHTGLDRRMDDFQSGLGNRMDDLRDEMRTGFSDIKLRLGKVEDRVSDLEQGIRLVRS